MAKRGNNEGTIFQKPSGRWIAQVTVEGKRISRTARTRAECHEWLRGMLDQIDQGLTFRGQNMTLGEYLAEWIASKKTTLRTKTAWQYDRLLARYVVPRLGRIKLKDLSLRLFNGFYARLQAETVGVSHIRYAHRVLHVAFEDAVKQGILGRNPVHGANLPKPAYKEMSILNEQQVNILLVAARTSRYRSLYQLAVVSGMRISELRGLTWSDVDFNRGTVSVRRQIQDIPRQGSVAGAPKTHSGTRTVRLGENTLNELREQKQRTLEESRSSGSWQPNDLVFPSRRGTPFAKTDVQRDFAQVLERGGLPRIRFHDLRHTAASLMLSRGIAVPIVSKMLGHANPNVTLTIYAHATLEMQDEAARMMDQIVTPVVVDMAALHPVATGCNRG